jgi:hypothetical protein
MSKSQSPTARMAGRPDPGKNKATLRSSFHSIRLVVEVVAERLLTFCYHESLQRNTIEPLNRIIAASENEARSRLLQEWSDIKAEESKYIQIAVSTAFSFPVTVSD